MKKRMLAVCLALCLVVGLLPSTALAAGGTWADQVETQPDGYVLDSSGKVTIFSADGLAWLAKQVNAGDLFSGKTVTLTDDIDLSAYEWVPIGTQANPFCGTFDGGNHTISGMSITVSETNTIAGLFGIVQNAVIQNVNLINASISGSATGTKDMACELKLGGIAASNTEKNFVTVTNCIVKLDVALTTTGYVTANIGGVLGYVENWTGSYATITKTNATLSMAQTANNGFYRTAAGAAIGSLDSSKNTTLIQNCEFSLSGIMDGDGFVSGSPSGSTASSMIQIGGAVGSTPSSGTSNVPPVVLLENTSCDSTLDFTSAEKTLNSSTTLCHTEIGGFFGRASYSTIRSCFAKTELNSSTKNGYFGNIAGNWADVDQTEWSKIYTYAVQAGKQETHPAAQSDSVIGKPIFRPLTSKAEDVYYIVSNDLTEGTAGIPFSYQTYSHTVENEHGEDENLYKTTPGINDGFTYSDGDSADIFTVTAQDGDKTVSIVPAGENCAVRGRMQLSSEYEIDFVLPVPVYPVGGAPHNIACTTKDISGGWTNGSVTTTPDGKATANTEVIVTADPKSKLVDSVTVTRDDTGETVPVTKTSGGVTGVQTYTFIMPESDVTVTGVFRSISKEFTLSPNPVEFAVYEGYQSGDVTPITVTITNTGDLDATFEGSKALPTSLFYDIQPDKGGWSGTDGREIKIAPGGTATFTVVPKPGLISDNNPNTVRLRLQSTEGGQMELPLRCNVSPMPTYVLTANPGQLSFEPQKEGYTAPSGQTVTLTNTGTGTLNVTLPISTHYDFTPVTGWNGSTASLAPGAAATVTVKPKEGLPAGDYQDTIRFDTDQSGIYAEVTASFSVTSYGKISISPASITVYTGGTGYTGVVNDQGQSTTTSNGLPQPGFYITLPEELNQLLGGNANAENLSQLLTFNYQDEQGRTRRWTLMPYGTVEHSTNVEVDGVRTARYIYRLSPGLDETDKEIPVRLQLKNGNEVIFSDQFTPSPEELYQKYNMTLYSGNLNPANITASLTLPNGQTVTCGVESTSGELIVRGLNNKDAVTDIADDESKLSGEQITAVTLGDITYYVNGSNVEVDKREGVKLLVDKVLDEGVLTDYIQKNMTQIPDGTYAYEQRYLDLVDSNNGNAYLTIDADAGQKMAIYWRAPEDLDENGHFYVIHFQALDRNYDNMDAELSAAPPVITPSSLVEIDGIRYVRFETSSFSPFVLMWETNGTTPTTVQLTYKANGGSGADTVFYYALDDVVTVSDNLWFTRTDYTFDSWNTRADGSGTSYAPNDTILMNGNKQLYAQWTKNGGNPDPDPGIDPDGGDATAQEFELHYRTNGGKYLSVESESRVWTKEYEDLPVPVRKGYTFEGWYWDVRLTQPVNGDVKVDIPTLVLYAKWTEEETVTDSSGVSRWLDTVNHAAYLSGYPDHSFGADRNMTRAEVAQMFYALLLDKDVKITTSFSDVPGDAWYAKAVNTLTSLGMLGGYPDGTYRPNAPITRAEFSAIALAFAQERGAVSCSYTDVPSDAWYYTYVAQATAYGWIGGYPDSTFRPNSPITRAEVCVIVNHMLGRSADKSFMDLHADALHSFSDVSPNNWAYYYIAEATNAHDYKKYSGGENWMKLL